MFFGVNNDIRLADTSLSRQFSFGCPRNFLLSRAFSLSLTFSLTLFSFTVSLSHSGLFHSRCSLLFLNIFLSHFLCSLLLTLSLSLDIHFPFSLSLFLSTSRRYFSVLCSALHLSVSAFIRVSDTVSVSLFVRLSVSHSHLILHLGLCLKPNFA